MVGCGRECTMFEDRERRIHPDGFWRWYTLDEPVEAHKLHDSGPENWLWRCGLGGHDGDALSRNVFLCQDCAIKLGVTW